MDITTVSDEALHDKNPVHALDAELVRLARKYGGGAGGVSFHIGPRKIFEAETVSAGSPRSTGALSIDEDVLKEEC